jgi:tRNA pseudouridine38-40 synthase
MRQIRPIIEYDGTSYSGWQIQPNGITIQQVLEEALAQILGEPVRLKSSGRTDAGVHALGMVAVFKTEKGLPLQAFSAGLNALIPPDIAVKSAEEVPLDFDARSDAVSKHYRYTVLNVPFRSPLSRLYAWYFRKPLDVERMGEAAAHFLGVHDFCAFRGYNCSAKTTVRTIFSLEVRREGGLVVIDVVGSGFLKNMVRIIAGTLVEVGAGKLAPDDIPAILSGGKRPDAGATAPAHGLCLMDVRY